MRLLYSFCTICLLLRPLGLPNADTPSLSVVDQVFSKTIKKEYSIIPDGNTRIINKYGSVNIKTWNQNRVKISVEIVVNAISEVKAQEVFNRIDITFSNSDELVKAETQIEARRKRWFVWNTAETKSDYQINYEVFIPKTNDLDVVHKYGDMYLAAMDGTVNLDIKNVNFKAEQLGNDSNVTFSYGNGVINRARDAKLYVGYAELGIDEASDLSLTSKYSSFSIGRAVDVNCQTKFDTYSFGELRDLQNTGKYDNFKIGKASKVEVEGKYTQVSVGEIDQEVDLDLEHGGANFMLSNTFRACALNGQYSDFSVVVAKGASYRMDAATTYAGIRYPSDLNIQFEKEQSSSHEVKGKVGKGESEILARLNFGSLKVRTQ